MITHRKKKRILPLVINFYCSIDPFWLLTICNECLDCSQLHSLLYSISTEGPQGLLRTQETAEGAPQVWSSQNIKMGTLLQSPQYSRTCSSLELWIWKCNFKDIDIVLQSGVCCYIWGRKVVLNIQTLKLWLFATSALISSCHYLTSTFLHEFFFDTVKYWNSWSSKTDEYKAVI